VPGGIEAQEALGQRDMIAWMLLPSLYNREGQDFEAKDEYAELPTAHRTALLWLPQTEINEISRNDCQHSKFYSLTPDR
jgi:hypothetical protein